MQATAAVCCVSSASAARAACSGSACAQQPLALPLWAARTHAASPLTARRNNPACTALRASYAVHATAVAEETEIDVTKMEPLGDRLLVKPDEAKETTDSGLILTGSAAKNLHEALIGTVLGKGEDVELEVNVGDKVLFSRYSSSDVETASGAVCFVAQKSILATLS